MEATFSAADLDLLIESVEYSQLHVSEAQGTPVGVRRDRLEKLSRLVAKLRAARRSAQN